MRRAGKEYAGRSGATLGVAKGATRPDIRRVVIEYLGQDMPYTVNFDYQTADEGLRTLVLEIEQFFDPSQRQFEFYSALRPPFFSDPSAVLYWSFLINPESCAKIGPDAIKITLYVDGRIRVEGASPLRPPPRTPADIPVVWLKRQPAYVQDIVSGVLAEMSRFAAMSRISFAEEARHHGAFRTRSWSQRQSKWLSVKSAGNVALDLTAGFDALMGARPTVSQELRRKMFNLVRYGQRNLPPPHEEMIQNCLKSPGLK